MQGDIINCDYLAATLLARMSRQTVTEPVKLDRDRWYRRFAVLGYSSISDDPLTAIIRHDELPGSCSRVIGKRHLPAINACFYQCRRDEIPDIYVSIARKYIRLVWDCILTNGNGAKGMVGKGSNELGKGMLAPSTAFAIAVTISTTLFQATQAALLRSVTHATAPTFGEISHGV